MDIGRNAKGLSANKNIRLLIALAAMANTPGIAQERSPIQEKIKIFGGEATPFFVHKGKWKAQWKKERKWHK
jgi:hypothetical protein